MQIVTFSSDNIGCIGCVCVCVTMLTAVKCCVPTLTHVIPSQGRGSVNSVASLDDDVFIMRCYSEEVEVYDAATFTLQRHITVHRLRAGCRNARLTAQLGNRELTVTARLTCGRVARSTVSKPSG